MCVTYGARACLRARGLRRAPPTRSPARPRLREEAQLAAGVLRELDEALLHLVVGAHGGAEGADHVRVLRDDLTPEAVELLAAHDVGGQPDDRREEAVRVGVA